MWHISRAQRRAPAIAAASLVMGGRLAAVTAGNTDLRTGWTRFQKAADYLRIANRVPSGGNDSMAEA
jgi:hypothetical protein